MKVVIVGRGRVGATLARALRDSGTDCQLIPGQTPSTSAMAEADLIILAVPDVAIADCAENLTSLRTGIVVLHCAGARGPEELAACRARGAQVGVMHPLISFADPKDPPAVRGATFMVAGDAAAIAAARHITDTLDARALVAPVHGPAYHALVAMTANGTVALANAAVPALERLGLGRGEAEQAIGALLRTVAENIEHLGVPRALTGPMVRGEAGAIAAHRQALARTTPDAATAYDAVAPLVLRCARDAGLTAARATEIEKVLGRRP